MRIKFNKEIEYFIKKNLFSEKFLLKKRLIRSIKKSYDQEITLLNKVINKDLDSVDVGVYRGVYSYQMSKLSSHVHSFEPNPLIYPYLEKNLKKIIKNITLYNVALSDKSEIVGLKIPKRFEILNKNNYEEKFKLGLATIHNENLLENNKYSLFKVRAEKLDNLIKNVNIGFIKIDVEGHEKNVLLGAEKIIKKCKPNLLVEIEERHTNDKVENIVNFINDLGYKSFFSDGQNLIETTKLNNYSTKNNFFFIP
jgi:FkbM family methyltransferase